MSIEVELQDAECESTREAMTTIPAYRYAALLRIRDAAVAWHDMLGMDDEAEDDLVCAVQRYREATR